MGPGERHDKAIGTPEGEERNDAPRESAGSDPDIDPREEEGWDQPQASTQRPPHRQDDQDDVQ